MSLSSNSRWNNLQEFQKKLQQAKYEEQKGVEDETINLADPDLKIHTNIDEDYQIHPSETSSAVEVGKNSESCIENTLNDRESNHSEAESTGTVIVYEEPEDYSNPVAELGYQIDTHPSDSNSYMEEVVEVNESEASEQEMSMKEKRKLRRSRERGKVTLGGEIKYTEADYERMNLIKYNYHEEEGQKNSPSEVSEDQFVAESSEAENFTSQEIYSQSKEENTESVKFYGNTPVSKEIEIEKGRNYKNALQKLYDKTSSSLTRNNIESANKNSRTKTDSSLFTLKGKLDQEDKEEGKNSQNEQGKQYWIDMVNKLKKENLELRQENIKLVVCKFHPLLLLALSEKDQSHREELKKIKDQSLKAIQDLDSLMEEKDEEFRNKVEELTYHLKRVQDSKTHSSIGSKSSKSLNRNKSKDEIAAPIKNIRSRLLDHNPRYISDIRVGSKNESKNNRHSMPANKSTNAKMKSRINSIQKSSVLPSYHREKSRQVNSSMRYTNSLPAIGSMPTSQIPSHLRQSIDQLGSESSEPVRSSLVTNWFKQPQVIEYCQDTTPQADDSASSSDQENILPPQEPEFVDADFYRQNIETVVERVDFEEEKYEDHYLHASNEDSLNNRIECFHLEDLGDQVIEEKAEEEETTTNQMMTNKEIEEPYSSIVEVYPSDEERIMDEGSVSRRSINTSSINIKKAKAFGGHSEL